MNVQTEREREFEDLLVEILTQEHDLPVYRSGDPLERRRRGMACLEFEYHYSSSSEAKAVVKIHGATGFSNLMRVDFGSSDSIARSAEDCESLALFLIEHMQAAQEALIADHCSGRLADGRREEDWS